MAATMDLGALVAFATVADTAGFSSAARRLGLPTSTVSRRVAALEARLGVGLLHRTTRRVSLTSAGAALSATVAPHLAAIHEALRAMPERDEAPSGTLRITAAVDIGVILLAEAVTHYAARYPAVRVEVTLDNRVVDLHAGGFDLALRAAELKDPALVSRRVSPLRGALFASPTYLARRGAPRTPDELVGHDWVVYRGITRLRLDAPGDSATIHVAPARIVCDDMMFLRVALRAGAGVGWLPEFLCHGDLAAGTLARVLPRHRSREGGLYLVWPAARHVPRKVTAFRDLVLELVRRQPLAAPETI